MKCSECRGACCEALSIPLFANPTGNFVMNENNRWLALHGKLVKGQNDMDLVKLEVACTKLTEDGRCGIYEDRPMTCVLYEPGGPDCLTVVKERRTADDYQRIRDDRDPLEL
jgi:Fe-S-cluster containining protein